MARYAIIADIHGNKEALLAALASAGAAEVERILCLGDIVGFNADSNDCVSIVREHGVECIAGNHDLIGIRRLGFERCSNKARYALKRTRRDLTVDSKNFLASLPASKRYEGTFLLVHGGVGDVQEYVRTKEAVAANAARLRRYDPELRLCFFAHTHTQEAYELRDGSARDLPTSSVLRLAAGATYFINPGSIDASRKRGDKMAEFAVYDSSAGTVQFVSVAYDHDAAEQKARTNGYRIGWAMDRLYSVRKRLRSVRRWRPGEAGGSGDAACEAPPDGHAEDNT